MSGPMFMYGPYPAINCFPPAPGLPYRQYCY
jgi:hypothetical protein